MDILEIAFWVVFGAFALYALFNALRRGGLKGALFDAQIERTVGEVALSGVSFGSQVLKVHVLRRDGQRLVGVELVSRSVASYQMIPVTLAPGQVGALVTLLQTAAGQR